MPGADAFDAGGGCGALRRHGVPIDFGVVLPQLRHVVAQMRSELVVRDFAFRWVMVENCASIPNGVGACTARSSRVVRCPVGGVVLNSEVTVYPADSHARAG